MAASLFPLRQAEDGDPGGGCPRTHPIPGALRWSPAPRRAPAALQDCAPPSFPSQIPPFPLPWQPPAWQRGAFGKGTSRMCPPRPQGPQGPQGPWGPSWGEEGAGAAGTGGHGAVLGDLVPDLVLAVQDEGCNAVRGVTPCPRFVWGGTRLVPSPWIIWGLGGGQHAEEHRVAIPQHPHALGTCGCHLPRAGAAGFAGGPTVAPGHTCAILGTAGGHLGTRHLGALPPLLLVTLVAVHPPPHFWGPCLNTPLSLGDIPSMGRAPEAPGTVPRAPRHPGHPWVPDAPKKWRPSLCVPGLPPAFFDTP